MARPYNQDKINKVVEYTPEQLMKMKRKDIVAPLNEKQMRFCEEYVRSFNSTQSAKKAGYSVKAAHVFGFKQRQKPEIANYIAWLKLRISRKMHLDTLDIVEQYLKIAFADVTDFVTVKNGKVYVTDSTKIDGSIVTEIKQGRDGITIRLADKMRALQRLEKYFNVMPKSWQQRVEERKVQLMEQKLELEKIKVGYIKDDNEDDGFIEALKESATEVWEGDS